MMDEPLVIADYDPRWADLFTDLRDRVAGVLGGLAVSIEHVGSTAVPGLAAKPVVDIDVVVATPADVASAVERLNTLGYEPSGRGGVAASIPGLVALRWPKGEPRHHVYVVVLDSNVHLERIALRDHLRGKVADRRAYAELKLRAARESRGDWERYSHAKADFIQRVLRDATVTRHSDK